MSNVESSAIESRASEPSAPESVYLVPYPKLVFLYPTYLTAIVAAIYLSLSYGDQPLTAADTGAVVMNVIFLGVLVINLVVLSFDFPRATSLTLVFLVAALVLGGYLLNLKFGFLPAVFDRLKLLHPLANATFYMVLAGFMTLLYLAMLVSVRFDYWEVRPNELLHHHGMLSDLKRFSAPDLRVDKEINDVFEYLLLRSGRLILHPSGEKRAIVLDNVLFVSRKEQALTRMLGALQVQVRRDDR
jgi:hypothetical protein